MTTMTKRETIAAMCLQGLLANPNSNAMSNTYIVKCAADLANTFVDELTAMGFVVNETPDVSGKVGAARIDDIAIESPFKHGDSKRIEVTDEMVERFQEIMYDEPVDPNLARAVLNIILNGAGK